VTGRLNGRYELREKLGQGSQGETYAAIDHGRDPSLSDKWEAYVGKAKGKATKPRGNVAIKCFRVGDAKAWKDVELAEREARILASLDHPKLPKYYDHFEEDGVLYLVMEKIEGESLAATKRVFDAAEVVRMMTDISQALAYLHGRTPPIVHRDVKPANILRRPDGSYALVDLGAVRDKLKSSGGSTVVGTFGFMAPEQFQGRASPRSDVYGLAATAITMLTGEEPENLPHEGLGIDVERAVPLGTPAPLVRALRAMLVPDPDQRVATVDDALARLRGTAPEERKTRRREERAEKKKQRLQKEALSAPARGEAELGAGRRPRAPLLPRLLARLGLLLAWIVVSVVVGLVVPFALVVLSLVFGSALRRAARSCAEAAARTRRALGGASRWLSGHDAEIRKVRVGELDRVRAVTPEQAQRIAIARAEAHGEDADAWLEEKLQDHEEKERRRERMRSHARPPKTRYWGR